MERPAVIVLFETDQWAKGPLTESVSDSDEGVIELRVDYVRQIVTWREGNYRIRIPLSRVYRVVE
jgi:hypothetical protein